MITLIGHDSGGILWGGYTFNATTGTITFTGIPSNTTIDQIISVYNCTKSQYLFKTTDFPLYGGTIAAGVLHLNQSCYGMSDTDVLQIYVDSPDAMQTTIETDHEHVHQGDMFILQTHYTITPTSSLYIQVTSGPTQYMHMKRAVRNVSILDVGYTLLEAPTFTTGTAALTPRNVNRNSVKVSGSTWFSNPTVVSGGTQLLDAYIPGTSFYRGLEDLPPTEIIYKPATTYIGDIHNYGSNPALVYLTYYWYEVPAN